MPAPHTRVYQRLSVTLELVNLRYSRLTGKYRPVEFEQATALCIASARAPLSALAAASYAETCCRVRDCSTRDNRLGQCGEDQTGADPKDAQSMAAEDLNQDQPQMTPASAQQGQFAAGTVPLGKLERHCLRAAFVQIELSELT